MAPRSSKRRKCASRSRRCHPRQSVDRDVLLGEKYPLFRMFIYKRGGSPQGQAEGSNSRLSSGRNISDRILRLDSKKSFDTESRKCLSLSQIFFGKADFWDPHNFKINVTIKIAAPCPCTTFRREHTGTRIISKSTWPSKLLLPAPQHVSTRAHRTLQICSWDKSATAERKVADPFRSDHPLGVPRYDPDGPQSFSTKILGRTSPRIGKLPSFPLLRTMKLDFFWV